MPVPTQPRPEPPGEKQVWKMKPNDPTYNERVSTDVELCTLYTLEAGPGSDDLKVDGNGLVTDDLCSMTLINEPVR